jgi:DNA replicative helicase MCM subunit Mcm2 (Cdc46/Mcm family)
VLAAANPHYGRYNVKKTISENINLPVALLSRFDLLFLLRDVANPDLDLQLAIHVCSVHQFLKIPDRQPGESKIADPKALKEHIAQARKVQPVVPQDLTECDAPPAAAAAAACDACLCRYIVGAYVNMRAEEAGANASGTDPGAQVPSALIFNRFAVLF